MDTRARQHANNYSPAANPDIGGANQYQASGLTKKSPRRIIDIVLVCSSQWTSTGLATGDGAVPNPNPGGDPGQSPNDGLNTAAYVITPSCQCHIGDGAIH